MMKTSWNVGTKADQCLMRLILKYSSKTKFLFFLLIVLLLVLFLLVVLLVGGGGLNILLTLRGLGVSLLLVVVGPGVCSALVLGVHADLGGVFASQGLRVKTLLEGLGSQLSLLPLLQLLEVKLLCPWR